LPLSKFLSGWLLSPSASTFGPQIDHLYNLVLAITGIVFVLTEVALIYFSFRYRRRPGKKALYSHGSPKAEIIWTAIPTAILVYLGFLSQNLWSDLRIPKNYPPPAVTIKVQAEQWLWHFHYTGPDGLFGTDDDIVVDNAFHIPIGKTVRFEITSQDVIHGFYIPDLRIHQDAVPGMTSSIWVEANRLGTYDVRCTQFCGTNHYQMKGQVTVESPEEFQTWLAGTKASAF
jgi:cytochrome c oxidase subunit 2